MEHIHSTNHRWFSQQGHLVDSPGLTTNFSADLDEYLVANTSHILAFRDRVAQNNLRRYRNLTDQKTLQVIVEGCFTLSTRQE